MTGLTALFAACGLAGELELLEAVVEVESGGNPIALAVNGPVELVRSPRDRGDAVTMARWLAAHGYRFDAGIAQVNSANLARLGLDAASVFEPCANLRAAAAVLAECRERARARGLEGAREMAAALSCYNTGHLTRGIRNGYVAAVHAALSRARGRRLREVRGRAVPITRSLPSVPRRPDVFALASAEASAASPEGTP